MAKPIGLNLEDRVYRGLPSGWSDLAKVAGYSILGASAIIGSANCNGKSPSPTSPSNPGNPTNPPVTTSTVSGGAVGTYNSSYRYTRGTASFGSQTGIFDEATGMYKVTDVTPGDKVMGIIKPEGALFPTKAYFNIPSGTVTLGNTPVIESIVNGVQIDPTVFQSMAMKNYPRDNAGNLTNEGTPGVVNWPTMPKIVVCADTFPDKAAYTKYLKGAFLYNARNYLPRLILGNTLPGNSITEIAGSAPSEPEDGQAMIRFGTKEDIGGVGSARTYVWIGRDNRIRKTLTILTADAFGRDANDTDGSTYSTINHELGLAGGFTDFESTTIDSVINNARGHMAVKPTAFDYAAADLKRGITGAMVTEGYYDLTSVIGATAVKSSAVTGANSNGAVQPPGYGVPQPGIPNGPIPPNNIGPRGPGYAPPPGAGRGRGGPIRQR